MAVVRNPDVLAGLSRARAEGDLPGDVLLVGFAAETGDDEGAPLAHAAAKLDRKGIDLLVLNDVSAGAVFGAPDTEVHLLTPDGAVDGPHRGSKTAAAHAIWDRVTGLRAGSA
jgi:phosphopantothenoylcysteine decarboxylase/phosphopantothenate--cysteine ligase